MNRQPGGAGGGAEGQDEIQSHKKKARTFLTSFNSRTSALEGQLKLKKKKRKASAVQGVIKTNQVNQKQKFTLEALLCAKTRTATCIKDQLFSPPLDSYRCTCTTSMYKRTHGKTHSRSRTDSDVRGRLVPFLLSL